MNELLQKTWNGDRISAAEALQLYALPLETLGALAHRRRELAKAKAFEGRGNEIISFSIDRNINYTNICTAVCDFCAFYRGPKSDEGWVLEREELLQKIEETVALGGDQILMQGGLHHEYKLDWYEQLCRDIKERFPQVNIHGFSPPELYHFTKMNGITIEEVLTRLKAAGLGSIPGGGAEILVDRVRDGMTRGKVDTENWLNVMRVWHQMGGHSSATMMYGHIETLEERIEHMERVRQLQDETNGFTAFISWTFQPDNTPLSDIQPLGSYEYLKVQAISRLYLDNVPNIQSSWVTQGLKIGQLALLYGANDMGSLMIEENVVAEAGTVHYLTLDQIRDSISELGFTPRQRNVHYELLDETHEQQAVEANREWMKRKLEEQQTPLVQLST